MTSSYYINQIEIKLKRLNRNPDEETAYNEIFEETEDNSFLRRLRFYNETLNKEIDSIESDGNVFNRS